MGLSSNILWHQTKKDGLRGIIKNKCLYYSYSVEDIIGYDKYKFAYPMVSVCDLPLAETGNYLKKYGDYTIGFCAEWGKRNNFSAVWYCDQNSLALKTIIDMLARKFNTFRFETEKDEDYQRIIYLLSYIKLYEGPLPKRNYKKYRFYDEREVRRVPDAQTLFKIEEKQMIWNYEEYKDHHNNSALLPKSVNIPFEWEDIKYIIVERDSEKEEFRKYIEKYSKKNDLKISFFTNNEVKEDIIGISHDEESSPTFEVDIQKLNEIIKEEIIKIMQEKLK